MTENKHTKTDLLQMQTLPLSVKINMSKRRIRDWYDYWGGEVYVSFSGGKDSTVLKHLVEKTHGDVPSLFVNTGLEFPEIQKFAMSQPNVITVRPEMRFDEVIKTYGYPVISKDVSQVVHEARAQARLREIDVRETNHYNRRFNPDSEYNKRYKGYNLDRYDYLFDSDFLISSKCCDVMKKKPAKTYEKETGRHPFIGTMACESRVRAMRWYKSGCNAFEKKRPTSQPLSFWTEQDILQYIVENNLEYCSLYGEIKQDENGNYYNTGARRTGCMFCMFGLAQDGCPNRFQQMKETHPNQYNYCMKPVEDGGLGLARVLDFMGEKY